MKNFFDKTTEQIGRERAKWIDDTIMAAIPEWKVKLILKSRSPLLAKILRASPEILHERIIAGFGTQTTIVLNGKVIGHRKYDI